MYKRKYASVECHSTQQNYDTRWLYNQSSKFLLFCKIRSLEQKKKKKKKTERNMEIVVAIDFAFYDRRFRCFAIDLSLDVLLPFESRGFSRAREFWRGARTRFDVVTRSEITRSTSRRGSFGFSGCCRETRRNVLSRRRRRVAKLQKRCGCLAHRSTNLIYWQENLVAVFDSALAYLTDLSLVFRLSFASFASKKESSSGASRYRV